MKHDKQYPELLNQFLDQLRTKRKSENTILNYGIWINDYIDYIKSIKYFKNDRIFGSIAEDDIWKYVDYLSNKKGNVRGINGNNGNTINRKLASVRTFYDFLVEKKIIEYNLFDKIKGVKQSKKVREDFTEEEIERLILAIQNSKDKFSLRNATFFIVLIDTGARKMELANLTLKQNKDNKYLVFEGKGDKEREVYFSEMGTKALEKYFVWRENYLKEKNRTSDYLFFTQTGNSFDDSYISKMLKKYGKIADINEEKLTPHNIRHFFATLKYNSGIDMRMIQELLGHSVITTTQIYIGVSREKKQEAAYNTRKLNIQI